jgi:uncharacterized membrane protein YfcA
VSLTLLILGFAVGTFGTLIGAGGGFILMPLLLLMYPDDPAEKLTALSLSVVFFNALSGSIAYARKRRVDYRSALIFSLASAPGALIGAHTTQYFARESFELLFGILMSIMAIYLLVPKNKSKRPLTAENSRHRVRKLVDALGTEHLISYNVYLGIGISVAVGFISSLLGIGGGIIHVPALVNLLHFPVHIATATSHAILAVMSAIATGEHFFNHHYDEQWMRVISLTPGVIAGAQLGAHLSPKVKDAWIIRALALALLSVGIRFIYHYAIQR